MKGTSSMDTPPSSMHGPMETLQNSPPSAPGWADVLRAPSTPERRRTTSPAPPATNSRGHGGAERGAATQEWSIDVSKRVFHGFDRYCDEDNTGLEDQLSELNETNPKWSKFKIRLVSNLCGGKPDTLGRMAWYDMPEVRTLCPGKNPAEGTFKGSSQFFDEMIRRMNEHAKNTCGAELVTSELQKMRAVPERGEELLRRLKELKDRRRPSPVSLFTAVTGKPSSMPTSSMPPSMPSSANMSPSPRNSRSSAPSALSSLSSTPPSVDSHVSSSSPRPAKRRRREELG